MRMLLLIALVCAPLVYAQSGQGPRHLDSAVQNQDDPVRLPAPKKGEAAIKDGEDAFAEGRMDDAVTHFTAAIDAQPENDELYAYRAAAYVALGKLDEAGEDIDEAVRLESTFSLTWNTRGYIAWMRGQHQNAVEHYTTAIAYAVADRRVDEGGLAQIYQNRGVAWQDLGNTDRALLDFNECIERVPDNPAFLENRGLVYVEKKLFDVAFLDFDMAVELDKNNARAYVNRAYAARQIGDFEQAIRDYSQALRLKESYPQALIGRGYTWLAWDQPKLAEKDFYTVSKLDGYGSAGELGLAETDVACADLDSALAHYNLAVELNAGNYNARYGLARLQLKRGEVQHALATASKLCLEAPGYAIYWHVYARACMEDSRWEKAMGALNRLIELAGDDLGAHQARLRCFIKLGLFEAAAGDEQWIRDHDFGAGQIAGARILLAQHGETAHETALQALQRAAEAGTDLDQLANDPDFDALKDNAEFKKLVGAE